MASAYAPRFCLLLLACCLLYLSLPASGEVIGHPNFVAGDCSCPAAGMTQTQDHWQSNMMGCEWTIGDPATSYIRLSHETWWLGGAEYTQADFERYVDGDRIGVRASFMANAKASADFAKYCRVYEEDFTDTRGSFIYGCKYPWADSYISSGRRSFIYKDIYSAHIQASNFEDGEDLKVKMDAVEACIKATLDKKKIATAPTGEYLIHGAVTDGFGGKIRNARVSLIMDGVESFSTTNDGGYYEFPYEGSVEDGASGEVVVSLQYLRDGKTYFRILNKGSPVWVSKKFQLNRVEDIIQDIDMRDGLAAPEYDGVPNPEFIRHFSIMYTHMSEALEYYVDYYHADVDYRLPVDVRTFVSNSATYYDPTDSTIVINNRDSLHMSPNRPKNREWHEFSHHVMYSMYGKWPNPPAGAYPPEVNHAGYINPSTSDSFVEGFAEYGAMMIGDYWKYPESDSYPTCGSLETDYRSWEYAGWAEEYAVAGVLWDLYDEVDDDSVDFVSDNIWGVIREYRPDFTSVYNALVDKYPGYKADFDEIFAAHGFWVDKDPGNRRWDPDEPYVDTPPPGNNSMFDDGEYFVDYPLNWSLSKGEAIGSASNYQRLTRTNAVKLPGHYVKVDNDVPYYTVTVSFPKNPSLNYRVRAENVGGLVYVPVPPQGYDAQVTVEAEDAAGKSLTFSSREFNDNFPESVDRGYFIEHDFQASGQQPEVPEAVVDSSGPGTPYWEAKDLVAEPEDYVYTQPEESDTLKAGSSSGGASAFSVPDWVLLAAGGGVVLLVLGVFAVALIAVVVVVFLKKKKK